MFGKSAGEPDQGSDHADRHGQQREVIAQTPVMLLVGIMPDRDGFSNPATVQTPGPFRRLNPLLVA